LKNNFGDLNDGNITNDANEMCSISKNQKFLDAINMLRLNKDNDTESYSN
jgi:hypothetical protein